MRNIIITGGELFNKGAMAMTLVTVYELKKRFPEHDVYLLSELDYQRQDAELEQYDFGFTGWYPIKFAKAQSSKILWLMCFLKNRKEFLSCENLYKNCDLMVDISGYALGSNWDYKTCNLYLEHIEYARAYNIPIYLLPQSFGPFDFKREYAETLKKRCFDDLSYAKMIFAREEKGHELLVDMGLTNVEHASDIVLCNKELDYGLVYKRIPNIASFRLPENSVGIIPNGMTLHVKDRDFVLDMYYKIIKKLLTLGKRVYILRHATPDESLCHMIKNMFDKDQAVELLENDFSCIEYNELVKQFQFIVASRYHSIIHAFKQGTPCIALGWADKYGEVMSMMGQEEYLFDLRNEINVDVIVATCEKMKEACYTEKEIIQKNLETIQRTNVFDYIALKKGEI